MKTLIFVVMVIGLALGFVSVCMAEDWYVSQERSRNDYRSSASSMVAETDGSKYSPQYTSAELRNTLSVADGRQGLQSGSLMMAVQQGSSPVSGGSSKGAVTMNDAAVGGGEEIIQ